ncbi:MAG: phosphoribosyl-AMP cyclohydrolase [Planctomycetaceae bacterium]|jgi:phosphoribosyl-AMP cyclohydrolase|nr:phosphoribosyl-AMP cyclohydrolase [Planctomycetaceae bacterium]
MMNNSCGCQGECCPDFEKCDGLLPVIAQDSQTGEVLMMAYMNDEAFQETLKTGRAVYFSRSRKKLWRKGEESGNVQWVKAMFIDCDKDTLLIQVEQVGGAACHEGYKSCFFRQITPTGLKVVGDRVFDPKEVYKK